MGRDSDTQHNVTLAYNLIDKDNGATGRKTPTAVLVAKRGLGNRARVPKVATGRASIRPRAEKHREPCPSLTKVR